MLQPAQEEPPGEGTLILHHVTGTVIKSHFFAIRAGTLLCPPTLFPRIPSPLPVHPIQHSQHVHHTCASTHLTNLSQRRHHSRHGNISPNMQLFSVNHCVCFNNPDLITILNFRNSHSTYNKLQPHKKGLPKLPANQSRLSEMQHRGTVSVSVSCWGGRDDPVSV